MITLIACIDNNFGIGYQGKLLISFQEDLKHFKSTTQGYPLIMGKKTWESLPGPLKGRLNIVLSSQPLNLPEGVIQCRYLGEALSIAQRENPVEQFIIGGGEIFKDSLVLANRIVLTKVNQNFPADTFFPQFTDFKIYHRTGLLKSLSGIEYEILDYRK